MTISSTSDSCDLRLLTRRKDVDVDRLGRRDVCVLNVAAGSAILSAASTVSRSRISR